MAFRNSNSKSKTWHWVVPCTEVSKLLPLVFGPSPLAWIISPDPSPCIPLPSFSLSCTWQPERCSWNWMQLLSLLCSKPSKVHTGLRSSLTPPTLHPSPSLCHRWPRVRPPSSLLPPLQLLWPPPCSSNTGFLNLSATDTGAGTSFVVGVFKDV